MNRESAVKLIKDLFGNSFSKENYAYFLKNLLNHFEEAPFIYAGNYIPGIFSENVKTIERIGKYKDINGKSIDLLIVSLKKENSLDRARSLQRNIIAWYLNGSRGGEMKDAALVAFISPNNPDWRFSFIKMEYKYEKTDKGKIKVKEHYTPAKRFSFLVGPNEASHTAQSRLLPLIIDDKINPILEEIEDIFSIEKVTKEFFEQYKKLFFNLAEEFSKNKEFEERVVREHKVEVADFVKKLMGQIVFLYFLQKKGWLGVKIGEKWGTGDKKFMHNLFDKKYCDYENFYNDILEPLFYGTLNQRDRGNSTVINDQSFSPYFKCRIPYLNGGLFSPIYNWKGTKIYINNNYFKDILDVFNTFNFTVYESDPIEKEVAVDPEMLGKVFENLLEIRDRKSKGAFYTPREIVHYMCQESLINYLTSNSDYPEERIRRLMKSKDQEIARTEKQKEEIENNPELKEIAIKVNTFLREVRVCDPAVGSGAFPMGLLKEISSTRYFLNKHFIKEKNKYGILLTEYDIKKETLENCIYGVDIDSGAVEIARLRFWLSLVVEHDIEEIEPLPNLDYKIMQGNSLIELSSPTLISKTMDLDRNRLIDELTLAKTTYFNLSDTIAKSKKREEINSLIREIVNYDKKKENEFRWEKIRLLRSQMGLFKDKKNEEQLSFDDATSKEISKEIKELDKVQNISNNEHFEWHLNFNEVFEKGGFDIVIANPPYVGENGHKDIFREIRKGNLSVFYMGKMDLFYFFFHLALNLCSTEGIVSFITTNYYPTAMGAKKLRKDFKERTTIKELINFNELKIFDSARGQHNMITILKKAQHSNEIANTTITQREGLATYDVLQGIIKKEDIKTNYYRVTQEDLYDGDEFYIRIAGISKASTDLTHTILDKIKTLGDNLSTLAYINQGIVSGCDYVSSRNINKLKAKANIEINDGIYVFNLKNPRDVIEIKPFNDNEKKLLRPFYKNSDIRKYWSSKTPSKFILYFQNFKNLDINSYPHIVDHFNKFKDILTDRLKTYGEDYYWKELHRGRTENIFTGEKIIVPYRSEENTFAFNNIDWFCRSDCYIITQKDPQINIKYLLAILNSKLYYFWLYHRGKRKGNTLELFQVPLSEIPIKKVSDEVQKPFIDVSNKILDITEDDNYINNNSKYAQIKEYEKKIDQMVYKLYGLTEEEIKIVEENAK